MTDVDTQTRTQGPTFTVPQEKVHFDVPPDAPQNGRFNRDPETEPYTDGQIGAAKVRLAKAVEMRLQGTPLQEIADTLGYSSDKAVSNAITKEIARRSALEGKISDMRNLEIQRLDRIMKALEPLVHPTTGNPSARAVHTWLELSERRARLLGLDRPIKIAPTTPDGSQPYNYNVVSVVVHRAGEQQRLPFQYDDDEGYKGEGDDEVIDGVFRDPPPPPAEADDQK